MSKHSKTVTRKARATRMQQIRSASREPSPFMELANGEGAIIRDGMGLPPDIRTFFEEPIQLSPGPAPFEGYMPEELDRLFAEIAAEPCFTSSTDGAGC